MQVSSLGCDLPCFMMKSQLSVTFQDKHIDSLQVWIVKDKLCAHSSILNAVFIYK